MSAIYKILLVDDEPFYHALLEEGFPSHLTVKCASSGENCFETLATYKPDIILLDVVMPSMGGYETCRQIKADPNLKQIPIFFLSASDSLQNKMTGYKAGGDDYIVKPFQVEEIAKKITLFLERYTQQKSIQADLNKAVDLAQTALNHQGEQGTVLQFLNNSFQCSDANELIKLIFEALSKFSLSGVVQIRIGKIKITENALGKWNPIEESIIHRLRKKGRIFSASQQLIFNYDHISLFIPDTSTLDNHTLGRYRDHLAQLLQGAESRILGLIMEHELAQNAKQEQTLGKLLRTALQEESLQFFLQQSLSDLIQSNPWLTPQGTLFLIEDNGDDKTLKMQASYNLTKNDTPLSIINPNDYWLTDKNSSSTGRFSQPIIINNEIIGFIGLQTSPNYRIPEKERRFLLQAAEVISMGIVCRYKNAALEKAKTQAETAAKAKSQFLATMSHEIRTPMNGVLSMLNFLEKTPLNEKQKRFVNTATHSGSTLLNIINDILDFSKLEADRIELEAIAHDPVALVEEVTALMAGTAHEKNIELICSIEPGAPRTLIGDPTRLRQIITNLLSNAIKFTEKGEVIVYITQMVENRIHFGVKDTGIGIKDKAQRKLFKSFSQVDNSHTRKYGGTGLGLAICQHLVEAMGGSIRVSSTPGIGSDFNFTIPIKPFDNNKKPKPPARKKLFADNFLILDDSISTRNYIKQLLKSWSAETVSEAENHEEAIKTLKASHSKFDTLLLDKNIPDQDANSLIKTIQSDPQLSHLKIILLCNISSNETIAGANAYVTKPIRQSDLFNTLLSLAGEHSNNKNTTKQQTSNSWYGGKKLLLTEDNEINQEVALEILNESGFEIDICETGADALTAVQDKTYDIVLMDIQMPVMDGLTAARKIRALGDNFKDLPIIAMTAHALSGDAEKSLNAGMNAHVTKPICPDLLFNEISQWVPSTPKSETGCIKDDQNIAVIIPDIPGIDIEEGLARFAGNKASYLRILKSFRNKYIDGPDTLSQLIKDGDYIACAQLAHSLKGSGGNIGAQQLYHHASKFEQACRDKNKAQIEALLPLTTETVTHLIEALSVLETHVSPDLKTSTPTDTRTQIKLLNQLAAHLESDLGAAQTSLAAAKKEISNPLMNDIENTLNSFEIDATQSLLDKLRTTLSNNEAR